MNPDRSVETKPNRCGVNRIRELLCEEIVLRVLNWYGALDVGIHVARVCVRVIRLTNTAKDERLAMLLHELAGRYQRDPGAGWTAPLDWECWQDDGAMRLVELESPKGSSEEPC